MTGGTFEIVIRGTVGDAVAKAFEEFAVSAPEHGLTRLVGSVPDQARLHGVLEMLRDLGADLVSVTEVE